MIALTSNRDEMDIEDDVSMDEVPPSATFKKGGHVAMTVSLAVAKSGRKARDPDVEGIITVSQTFNSPLPNLLQKPRFLYF